MNTVSTFPSAAEVAALSGADLDHALVAIEHARREVEAAYVAVLARADTTNRSIGVLAYRRSAPIRRAPLDLPRCRVGSSGIGRTRTRGQPPDDGRRIRRATRRGRDRPRAKAKVHRIGPGCRDPVAAPMSVARLRAQLDSKPDRPHPRTQSWRPHHVLERRTRLRPPQPHQERRLHGPPRTPTATGTSIVPTAPNSPNLPLPESLRTCSRAIRELCDSPLS